jgi:tight adherence protein B
MLFFALFLGLFGALAIAIAVLPGGSGKAASRRLDAVRSRHGAMDIVETQLRKIAAQRTTRSGTGLMRLLPNQEQLQKRLEMTGKSWSVSQYAIANGGVALFGFLAMLFKGLPILIALFVGLFLGLGLPHFIVGRMISKRGQKFTLRFPDAIELLVRGLRSGLPISETLGVVAHELPGPVGEEFRTVTDKMKIGRTMDAALQDTADRLQTPEFQFFVISLAIQRETGGNLAETLSNLADVLRKRMQMKLKVKAMSSESKASAYIIGSLPFIVFGLISYVNPDYMAGFFSDTRLIIAACGAGVWMSIGVFIMAQMINFEI